MWTYNDIICRLGDWGDVSHACWTWRILRLFKLEVSDVYQLWVSTEMHVDSAGRFSLVIAKKKHKEEAAVLKSQIQFPFQFWNTQKKVHVSIKPFINAEKNNI